ncbi:MAG: histidine phosphatase family protein [Clostridia bacterium]|nr:histidine phosphatase family protein [Clostridia bacterium]MBQ4543096.1 histidine phosphatase family protein [Clostridia bacterium]MBQ9997707.1 histidine phosphatase family protein [Clostridia bacterium]
MVTFVIVRHGYSKGNKEKRFSGQMDVPLDEIGLSQAEAVAQYITENFKIDKIYSSDLSRAVDTVKPIAQKLGIPVNKVKELREADVGEWQGLLIETIKEQYAESFEFYRQNPGLARFDGGESYKELMDRSLVAFDKIAKENDGKTILVGTHGGVIRTLRAGWNNIPLENLKEIPHVPNASVTVVQYDKGKVNWLKIGCSDHLTEKTTEEAIK